MPSRRDVIAAAVAGSVAGLPRFSIGQTADARTLRFVPQANLSSLDPIWTTATVTRNFGYLVWDTLYGTDDQLRPQPQMADGHTLDDNGLRWSIHLRDALVFHDGEPVRARDCVASLQRWMKRDGFGQSIASVLEALDAPDDRTIVFHLRKPFPPLLKALAKSQPSPAFIMPERIAATDPFKQITEIVGSGPFRFVADEYVAGNRVVLAKFAEYAPRTEPPSSLSGAKSARVDRVEWRIIPEASTAANALRSGEVDWLEMPLTDLLPTLRSDRNVVVGRLDPYGLYPVLRPNHLQGPTTDVRIRSAILAAIDAPDVMRAIMGDDTSGYHAPVGAFLPGTDYASQSGMDLLGPKPSETVRAMLRDAGYRGEPLVLMHPTDQPFYDAMTQVVSANLKDAGFTVDDRAMDWGTVVQRRNSREPLDRGGWSLFCTSFPALDYTDPLAAPALRGNGTGAWYGWPDQPEMERLRQQFIDATDETARKSTCRTLQEMAFERGMYVPLGQYFQSAAWRSSLTGHLKAQPPLFWNVQKG